MSDEEILQAFCEALDNNIDERIVGREKRPTKVNKLIAMLSHSNFMILRRLVKNILNGNQMEIVRTSLVDMLNDPRNQEIEKILNGLGLPRPVTIHKPQFLLSLKNALDCRISASPDDGASKQVLDRMNAASARGVAAMDKARRTKRRKAKEEEARAKAAMAMASPGVSQETPSQA